MPTYRIYTVEAGGRLRQGRSFHALSEAQAETIAATLAPPGQAAELWQGGRLVGRFSERGEYSRASGRA